MLLGGGREPRCGPQPRVVCFSARMRRVRVDHRAWARQEPVARPVPVGGRLGARRHRVQSLRRSGRDGDLLRPGRAHRCRRHRQVVLRANRPRHIDCAARGRCERGAVVWGPVADAAGGATRGSALLTQRRRIRRPCFPGGPQTPPQLSRPSFLTLHRLAALVNRLTPCAPGSGSARRTRGSGGGGRASGDDRRRPHRTLAPGQGQWGLVPHGPQWFPGRRQENQSTAATGVEPAAGFAPARLALGKAEFHPRNGFESETRVARWW